GRRAPGPHRAGAASASAHAVASTDHAAIDRRAAPTMSDATTPADYDGICNNGCTTRCYARKMSAQISEQGVRDEAARSGFRVEDEEPWRRGGLGLPLSIAGLDSRRLQRGGFKSERAAREALARAPARLRRE